MRDAAEMLGTLAPALALARRSWRANGLQAAGAEFVDSDVSRYLRETRETFDLVILDPPALAKQRKDVAKGARAYKDLHLWAFRRVASGGSMLTFTCSQHVDADLFRKIVLGAAVDALAVRNATAFTADCLAAPGLGVATAITGILRHRRVVSCFLDAAYRVIQLITGHAVTLGNTLARLLSTGEVISVGTADVEALGSAIDGKKVGDTATYTLPNGRAATVEILEGYRRRDKGEVTVVGFDPGRGRAKILPRAGVVLQKTGGDRDLTRGQTGQMEDS